MFSRRTAPLLLAMLVIVPMAAAQDGHLWVGPNVNMVSGTTWPDGDPFLQRQNEPSVAVSTRNPMHLMAASNDYRTVDLPGLPEGLPTADSWIGVYTSLDGGGSWTSTLLPGYPQDQTSVGQASPIYLIQAAADPVMRAGTHGLFYLSGIVFDRGDLPQSKLFVARYMDLNNDPFNPIEYIDTVEVTSRPTGSTIFIDKPWIAVDIPRLSASTAPPEIPQDNGAVKCGNLYLAWAEIDSSTVSLTSKIMSSYSTDCGSSWNSPIQLNTTGTLAQGATIAVSPDTGHVHVAWRQFAVATQNCVLGGGGYWKNAPEAWPVESLVIGGGSYSKQAAIDILNTSKKEGVAYILAQQLIPAKLNVFSGAVDSSISQVMVDADDWLVAHPFGAPVSKAEKNEAVVLQKLLEGYNKGTTGPDSCTSITTGFPDAILAVHSTYEGQSFSSPVLVSEITPFDQATTDYSFRTNAYPTMTIDDTGRAYLAWTTRGLATGADPSPVSGDSRIVVSTSLDGSTWTVPQPIDQPEVPGHQIKPSLTYVKGQLFLAYLDFREDVSDVFERFVVDYLTPDRPYRHTTDVRVAVADPAEIPLFTDYSIIDYLDPEIPDEYALPSTQVSRYLFMPTMQGTGLIFEQLEYNPPNLPMFKAGKVPFFGDYVDIAGSPPFVPGGDYGWTYNTDALGAPTAHVVWTDNRDVVGPPPPDFDWTSFVPPGEGGTSIFDDETQVPECVPEFHADRTQMRNQNIYTATVTSGLSVLVPGNSRPLNDSFQRGFVVFVQNDTRDARFFRLQILDQPPSGKASFDQFDVNPITTKDVVIEAYSSASTTVFASSNDPSASIRVQVIEVDGIEGEPVDGGLQSAALINPDPSNPYPSDPNLMDGEVHTPAVYNPAVYNPAVYNPAVFNYPVPELVFDEDVFNPAVFNQAIFNDAVLNYNVATPAVFNDSIFNPAVLNPAVFNPAVLNMALMNPAVFNPAVLNPAVFNPAVFNPAVFNPAVFNPAVFNPAVLNPAVLNPAVFNPAVLNPAVYNPAVFNPAVFNPAVLNPAVFNTTFADESATDFNLVAENHGNTTSSYTVNLSLLSDPPGFTYQLMIYRLYFTPVVDECELTEAAHQEILVNDLDPDVHGDLLDKGEVSFYLDPNDYAVITLRILPDPDNPGDPSQFPLEDISASVIADAVDTDDEEDGKTQPPFDTFGRLNIYTASLPGGNVGSPYDTALVATGGSGSYTWSLKPGSGTLPDGLGLGTNGVINGTPTTTGVSTFTVQVTDGAFDAEKTLSIAVAPDGGGPLFVAHPSTTTAGEPIPEFDVMVLDGAGQPWAGIEVTLRIGSLACSSLPLAYPYILGSAITDAYGIATFSGVTIDRGGYDYTLMADADVVPSPVTVESDPFSLVGFCETNPMASPRVGATSTRLADGRVLVVGGGVESSFSLTTLPLATAEIYDPAIPGWLALGPGVTLNQARALHTATLLDDGTVLIAGGTTSSLPATGGSLSSLEIFNPAAAGSFTTLGSTMTPGRIGHTATLLQNGKVLLAGGRSAASVFPYLDTAEIFDPATGALSAAGNQMPITGRDNHTATLLNNGTVLLAGGASAPTAYLNSAVIFDPSAYTGLGGFSSTDGMTAPRINHTATLLGDGRVLVAGGTGPGGFTHNTAEIFDPSNSGDEFGTAAVMTTLRERHVAATLPNGEVLLAGGTYSATPFSPVLLDSAETFNPTTDTFEPTHNMATARQHPLATELPDGRVLVTGGMDLSLVATAEAEVFHKPKSNIVWFLDNLDPDYSTPPFDDSVAVMDSGGSTIGAATGFNICQAGGAYRAISVAPQGDYALVVEFCGSPDRLTRIDPYGNVDYSVAFPEIRAVDISGNGFAYALVGETISGNSIAKIDPATGAVVDTALYGGIDLVIDDAHDAIWIVGDQIRKVSRNLTISHFVVTPNPIAHAAFSVDVASDGSAWVAEKSHPGVPSSEDRLLKIGPSGTVDFTGPPLLNKPGDTSHFSSVRVYRGDNSVWTTYGTTFINYDEFGNPGPFIKLLISAPGGNSGWSIAVDQDDGSVWLALKDGTLTHYTRDLAEIVEIPAAPGDSRRDAWVTLGVDPR